MGLCATTGICARFHGSESPELGGAITVSGAAKNSSMPSRTESGSSRSASGRDMELYVTVVMDENTHKIKNEKAENRIM
jgi:hypothetical protein